MKKIKKVHFNWRMFKNNPPLFREAIERFQKKQQPGGPAKLATLYLRHECMFWTGTINAERYGEFSFQDKNLTDGIQIHGRATHFGFYMANRREIKKGKIITHLCQMNLCVEPSHLIEGTDQSNMLEALEHRNQGNIPPYNKSWKTPTSDIYSIKFLHFQYGYDAKYLHEMFPNVTLSMIYRILSGRNWWFIDISNLLTGQGSKRK